MRSLLLAAALASAGCPPSHHAREFPRWVIAGSPERARGCAQVGAYVRKSGKEGIGVTVALRSVHDCDVRITRAALVWPDGARAEATLAGAQPPLVGRSVAYRWVAIAFDGDAAWNAGKHRATLELELSIDGARATWGYGVEHRFPQAWRDTWASP